jgi:signal transduction histidine kinase
VKVQTKLLLLAVGAMFLPVFLVGGYLFLRSNFTGASSPPKLSADRYYETLREHCASLPDFIDATRSLCRPAIGMGKDGAVIFSNGGEDDIGTLLHSIGRGGDQRPAATNQRRLSLRIESFDVRGYGEVRVLTENQSTPRSNIYPFQVNPLFVISFGLLLFIAGFGLRIARSLQHSLDQLGEKTARLAGGDLDTPIVLGVGEDIARLALALEKLRLSLKSERAKRARLIMGVSHDFRTPISLIKGYADALKDHVAKDAQTEERYLAVIMDKTGQLEGLIDDFLDYVRMEGDQNRGDLPCADISVFFKSLASEFAEDAAIMDRRFTFTTSALDEIFVSFDTKAAGRAFRNLFTNAVRYTQKDGAISLKVEAAGQYILASIFDDGIGIAPDDRKSIFEPFFRGKNASTQNGSGLGLAVVKSMIESHGWGISCTSELGMGTCFTVTIPFLK